jgi:hypothetical protein
MGCYAFLSKSKSKDNQVFSSALNCKLLKNFKRPLFGASCPFFTPPIEFTNYGSNSLRQVGSLGTGLSGRIVSWKSSAETAGPSNSFPFPNSGEAILIRITKSQGSWQQGL